MSTANTLPRMDLTPFFENEQVSPEVRREEAARLKAIYQDRKQRFPGLNQEVLAEQCGWSSQGTVSQYLNAKLTLNFEALSRLSKALQFHPIEVSPRLAEKLGAWTDHLNQVNEAVGTSYAMSNVVALSAVAHAAESGRMLPLIGSVQAGSFCEAVDNYAPGDGEEMVHSGGPVGPRAFVLRVDGISMIPDFYPGDMAVVDPDLEAGNGHFVVAKRVSDQGVTLKRLRFEGGEVYLVASNESWPEPIIKLTEEWHICGRVRRKIVEM